MKIYFFVWIVFKKKQMLLQVRRDHCWHYNDEMQVVIVTKYQKTNPKRGRISANTWFQILYIANHRLAY